MKQSYFMLSVNDGNSPAGLAPPAAIQVPQFDANAALAQIATFNQQIADSEANLRAQFESIELQKEVLLTSEDDFTIRIFADEIQHIILPFSAMHHIISVHNCTFSFEIKPAVYC